MMQADISRRSFVVGTCAAAAAFGVGVPAQASELDAFSVVVRDNRFAASQEFAAVLSRGGASIVEARGELVREWHAGLRAMLGNQRARIAGITSWSDFTIMRACAAELGMRVRYEGTHDSRHAGQLHHELRHAGDVSDWLFALRTQAQRWPQTLAVALSRSELTKIPDRTTKMVAPADTTHAGTLFSWVIAR
jgi:hypothetical protein